MVNERRVFIIEQEHHELLEGAQEEHDSGKQNHATETFSAALVEARKVRADAFRNNDIKKNTQRVMKYLEVLCKE